MNEFPKAVFSDQPKHGFVYVSEDVYQGICEDKDSYDKAIKEGCWKTPVKPKKKPATKKK
jgi:hypothetical protein